MNKIDGYQIADQILSDLKQRIDRGNLSPKVVIFYNPIHVASAKYAQLKKTVGKKIGVKVVLKNISTFQSTADLIAAINLLQESETTTGIMVQLPLPDHFNTKQILHSIPSSVDVDVLNPVTRKTSPNLLQPVAGAVMEVLEYAVKNGANLSDGSIHVIGEGYLVGQPVIAWLQEYDITPEVYVAGNDLGNLRQADVIIAGAGAGHIVKPYMIKDDSILIDAGTSSDSGKLIGDIHPDCYQKSSFYTPVPGGIGPITLAILMKNIVGVSQT